MATKTWVVGSIIAVVIVIAIIVLYKLDIISKAIFFIFLFFLVIGGLLLIFLKFQSSSTKGGIIRPEGSKNSLREIFNKINTELGEMPDSETLLWERGKDISTSTKDFLDNQGKNNRFIAIQAVTKYSRKTIVVYYNSTEGILWNWKSSPSPTILSDPFHRFEPYQRKIGIGSPQDIMRQKAKQRKAGVVVMPSDIQEESEVDNFVDNLGDL